MDKGIFVSTPLGTGHQGQAHQEQHLTEGSEYEMR
jgi:hypothetical protein